MDPFKVNSNLPEDEGVRLRQVRVQIIRHARTHSVGKYQPCMVSNAGLIAHARVRLMSTEEDGHGIRVRADIIGYARINMYVKYQSCMFKMSD